MNRVLLVFLICCCIFGGCKKAPTGLAQVKAQAVIDDKIIQNYLQSFQDSLTANKWTVKSVDSAGKATGIYYIVINPGIANTIYTNSTQITVGYNGRLLNTGRIFANTDQFHPSYILSQTIRGWRLGIPKINKGGEIRLIIPSYSAYGPFAQPTLGLPANAILYFDIKLFDVTN